MKQKRDLHKDSINENPQHFEPPPTQTVETLKIKANKLSNSEKKMLRTFYGGCNLANFSKRNNRMIN